MDIVTVLCIICGLVFGIVVGLINSTITFMFVRKNTKSSTSAGMIIRLVIDAAALAAGFFVSKAFDLPMAAVLLPIAIGLSLFGFIFLRRGTEKYLKELQKQAEEKDKKPK